MRQRDNVRIGVYFKNTAYRVLPNYPINLPVWNMRNSYRTDYVGDAHTTSLSGFRKPNPSGVRATLDLFLDNSSNATTNAVIQILRLTSQQFDRQILPESIGGSFNLSNINIGAGTVTIPNIAGLITSTPFYYTGLSIYNGDKDEYVRIISNTAQSVFTVEGSLVGWGTGDGYQIVAEPNMPTYIGVSPQGGNVAISEFYVLTDGGVGLNRELTINKQLLTLSLEGAERKQVIPAPNDIRL